MSLSAFPYPGGKTNYVDEILQYFPEHRRYVEPFGGSGALLLNKPESYTEVFNDRNEDIVHFFRVVRKHREELADWLRHVPYSRALHGRWAREFYAGLRPKDDIERAGRWFYLRYTQYGGKIDAISGYKASGKRNEARSFRGAIENLEEVVDRLQMVNFECEDYRSVIDRYDSPETLFYCDPPYVGKGSYYNATDFDHATFLESLMGCEGKWIISYGELPEELYGYEYVQRHFQVYYSLDVRENEDREPSTERLLMNFEPSTEPSFSSVGQQTFADVFTDDHRVRTDGGRP